VERAWSVKRESKRRGIRSSRIKTLRGWPECKRKAAEIGGFLRSREGLVNAIKTF
jgi:hypothetical protein